MNIIKTVYYGSKLSENRTRTPEGFLVCHNVPIARLGSQEYLAQEIGLDDQYGEVIEVFRVEQEVFSPAAIASFEGKPFTDDHPSEEVTPDNANCYIKGMIHNVRRGTGDEQDLLLADIIVYDKQVIRSIEQGKREVSSGYNCFYEQIGDKQYKQTSIRGNHVALVKQGRAGKRVAIKDEKPKQRRDKLMSKKSLWGKMVQSFAQDATPEEMEQVVDEMAKACGSDPTPNNPPAQTQDEPNPLEARIDKLEGLIMQLIQGQAKKQEPDALDALESELQGDNPVTTDEGATVIEEDEPAKTTVDSAVLLSQIAAMKPLVAQIKDPAERKNTSDTLAAILRQNMAMPVIDNPATYGQIQKGVMDHIAAVRANDAKGGDLSDLGKQWAKQLNPHYKEDK